MIGNKACGEIETLLNTGSCGCDLFQKNKELAKTHDCWFSRWRCNDWMGITYNLLQVVEQRRASAH